MKIDIYAFRDYVHNELGSLEKRIQQGSMLKYEELMAKKRIEGLKYTDATISAFLYLESLHQTSKEVNVIPVEK